MYVCVCNKVSDRDIRQAIEDGAHSMKALQKATGAGTNCGSCAHMTKSILNSTLQDQLAENPDLYYAA